MKTSILGTDLLLLFVIISCTVKGNPPPELQPEWERIYVKDVGSFDLPPTMEIQKGKYKELSNDFKRERLIDEVDIVAQQKGLNEFGKEGYKRYARIMFDTDIDLPGTFYDLYFSINQFKMTEINELNSLYLQSTNDSFIGTGLKVIEWHPLKIEKINEMSCIHLSYIRQLNDNPLVLVHIYMFHNNNMMHSLTMSYRLSESDYWKDDFNTALKSFRITNVK